MHCQIDIEYKKRNNDLRVKIDLPNSEGQMDLDEFFKCLQTVANFLVKRYSPLQESQVGGHKT